MSDPEKRRPILTGRDVLRPLHDAGLLPPNCRALLLVIDIQEAVKVFYECFGDEPMFTNLDLAGILAMSREQTARGATVKQLLESALDIITNAGWDRETDEWRSAAANWLDAYQSLPIEELP